MRVRPCQEAYRGGAHVDFRMLNPLRETAAIEQRSQSSTRLSANVISDHANRRGGELANKAHRPASPLTGSIVERKERL
jgi:hypothetical protein